MRERDLTITRVPLDEIVPYDGNAKLHTNAQIDAVEASIKEFGFANPVLLWHNDDGRPEIIAGHARCIAARNLGMTEVPAVFLDDLSDSQRRALTLVDNQTTMMTGWDQDQLAYELDVLQDEFEMADFGFKVEIDDDDQPYTDKVEGLLYEPSNIQPSSYALADLSEVELLLRLVEDADVSDDLKAVMRAACYRFARFDYSAIADFYANGDEAEKELIEALHLVIVDYGGRLEQAAARFVDEGMAHMEGRC